MNNVNLPLEAERIAELGYPVFPCFDPRNDPSPEGKRGKIPLVQGGVSSATTDLEQIAKWWKSWPTANIGLACKKCLVLDLDTKDGKDGVADITAIADSLGPLDPNVIATTGSGGWHLFFAKPNVDIIGKTTAPWQGKLTGIDIRVGNQYVIAPPSLHEFGKRYEWTKPLVPPEELLPIPDAWLDGFLPKKEAAIILPKKQSLVSYDKALERCRKYISTMPEAVSGSGGHPATLAVANAIFWGFGLDERSGWPILLEYNSRCKPPWSEGELRHKMNDALNKPPPGKEHGWLLNANKERYQYDDFTYQGVTQQLQQQNPSLTDRLIAPQLSTFERENITFLWQNRLLNGKLILFCGDGSVGKTWFLCVLCAVVSRGLCWPDGSPTEQGGVIFFTSEDGAGDTLRPRIEDNGGDPEHVFIPEIIIQPNGQPKEFTIKEVQSLEKFINEQEKQHGPGYIKLVIFDPITAFMGEIDEFKNNQVRAAFRPLARLAEEKKFAWIGVGHPKKGAELGKAKDAFSGSIAYTNAARLVWNFYHDRESGVRRMLLAKNNLIIDPKGLGYLVNDGVVSFTDTNIEMDADEYQRQTQKQTSGGNKRQSIKTEEAIEWLFEYLKDGPKPSGNKNDPKPGTVFGDAAENGFKNNTIWKAADELGVHKQQEKFSKRWLWSLDEFDDNPDQTTAVHPEFEAFG